MSNVLVIYEVKDNTTDNNITSLKRVLANMSSNVKVRKSSSVTTEEINWCDVCIANRPNSPYSVSVIKTVKRAGGFVIVSLDDDIMHLPDSHPNSWKKNYTIQSMELGDALLSPNPLILEDNCAKYHLRSVLTRSFVEEHNIMPLHDIHKRIRIVYPAGKDHIGLFNKYIMPFFHRLIENYKDRIDFTFVGIEPDVERSEMVHFMKGMPYEEYLAYMRDNAFDIGIAPLEDNSFCARKYFPKYLEYSRFGIAGIYSNVAPYTFAIEDQRNGLLVGAEPKCWENALAHLIENPQDVNRIVKNAQSDLREHFTLENAVDLLREGCQELENYHHNGEVARFEFSLWPTICYMVKDFYVKARYHLRHEGIKYLWTK